MVKLDLQGAYLLCTENPASTWDSREYKFSSLLFGLGPSSNAYFGAVRERAAESFGVNNGSATAPWI